MKDVRRRERFFWTIITLEEGWSNLYSPIFKSSSTLAILSPSTACPLPSRGRQYYQPTTASSRARKTKPPPSFFVVSLRDGLLSPLPLLLSLSQSSCVCRCCCWWYCFNLDWLRAVHWWPSWHFRRVLPSVSLWGIQTLSLMTLCLQAHNCSI